AGEASDGRVHWLRTNHALHDLRIEHRSPVGHLVQGHHELVHVDDPLLQEVSDTVDTVSQQVEGVATVEVRGEHDHSDFGVFAPNPYGRIDPFLCVCRWHPDVGEHDVWLVRLDRREERIEVDGRGDDVDPIRGSEQRSRSFTDEVTVLGDDQPE